MEYPYVPAAFINAIAEEGTKDEAVEFLQKYWNENCWLRNRHDALVAALENAIDLLKQRAFSEVPGSQEERRDYNNTLNIGEDALRLAKGEIS